MPGLTSLAVAESDERVAEALRFGFEREGVRVALSSDAEDVASQAGELQVVVVGSRVNGVSGAQFLTELGRAGAARAPVLYIGNYTERANAMAAGATQFLGRPVFVRDAVTTCRLLAGGSGPQASSPFVGELSEHRGLYYLMRAICALSFTGVLTLARGIRRGEMRFFAGEVTSASLGMLHGQAALHQLMLWTEARLELRTEDVVRRRQIPLTPEELLQDVRRFLLEMRSIAPWLSPSAVYQRSGADVPLPLEVGPVLQLFDGVRTIADAIEDSPFRVFETLRVAARLVELGVLERRLRADDGPPSAMKTLEDWLVGPPDEGVTESESPASDDWEAILPSTEGAAAGYAAVVPSESTGGEIEMPGIEPQPRRAPTAETRPLPKLEKLALEEGLDDAGDPATNPERSDEAPFATDEAAPREVPEAGGPEHDSEQQATEAAQDDSDSKVVKDLIADDQRAALNDEAGVIAESAKVASRAAQRAASEPGGATGERGAVSGRDAGATAGEIEAARPSEGPAEARDAGTILVEGEEDTAASRRSPRRRPATDPELAADAARVAAGAAQTARAAAAAFTAAEEAFFAEGDEFAEKPPEPVENFEDLDPTPSAPSENRGLVGRLFRKLK